MELGILLTLTILNLIIGIIGFCTQNYSSSAIVVGYIFTIIGIGFLIGTIYYIATMPKRKAEEKEYLAEKERREKGKKYWLDQLPRKIMDRFYLNENKKIMGFEGYETVHIYKYSDLIDFELVENGEKIYSEKQGAIGRAIVGGALFGAVGAVIGASTAQTQTIQTVEEMYIIVYFANGKEEKLYLLYSETNKSSSKYKEACNKAENVIAVLHAIKHSSTQ